MKHFKLAIILLIIGIAFIVSGNSLLVYKLLNNEKLDGEKLVKNIEKNYESFKKNVEVFNSKKEEYDSKVASNLFAETTEDYSKWIEIIDDYTKIIVNMDNNSKFLKENCVNKSHADKEVMNKCSAYMIAYEECVNIYVTDISEFNSKIEEFSEENKDDKLVEYELEYSKVDLNNDGKFEGTE